MKTTQAPTVLPGSERTPKPDAHSIGPLEPDQSLEITVRLRAAGGTVQPDRQGNANSQAPAGRRYLSREEFARAYGASAADVAVIKRFAHDHQLVVVSIDVARRSVVLSGTVAAMNAAFHTQLDEYEYPQGAYRGRVGHLSVPDEVACVVEGVFGLDDRPQATSKFQLGCALEVASPQAAGGAFTPPELARLYNFPTALDGSGQCIGIIELGGGSRPADVKAYFKGLGLHVPRVKIISVDHAKNRPSTPTGADGEVMLDIEVAGAIAPQATIAVYFAPNTDRGFLDAVTTAVHDKVNRPSVISISWGAAEVHWTQQAMAAFEQAFTDAAVMGVTICCAVGDNGSSDGVADGAPHVDFPASAPHALSCGGTRLMVGSSGALSETVWNAGPQSATGGGYSAQFPVPAYQSQLGANWTGRGVPDVSGNADPASGYIVRVDGQQFVLGGTSAVAPLWAGLIALLNQHLAQPVGFLHPLLYGALVGKGVTRDITQGNNGTQAAQAGWDACTGWGVPEGQRLLDVLVDNASGQ